MEMGMADAGQASKSEIMAGALLDAAIARAGFDGWTNRMIELAERDADLPVGTGELLYPGGVVAMIDGWAHRCDQTMADRLAAADLAAMKIRDKVTLGVRERVNAIGERHREAARRAAGRLAFPDGAATAAAITWRAADGIWRAIGDQSTDGNYYSKRAILSGVIASVAAAWLNADGPDDDAPWRILDRRIAAVMQFEKAKAQARKVTARLPSVLPILSRLRYPQG